MTLGILITAFRRPHSLKLVLDRLEHVSIPVYVWLNGPENAADLDSLKSCMHVVNQSSVNVVEVKENSSYFESGQSIVNAISWIFTNVEMAIILEDDILLNDSALEFFQLGLNEFQSSANIASLIGTSFLPESFQTSSAEFRLTNFTSSWGWATWADKWRFFESDLANWNNELFAWPKVMKKKAVRRQYGSKFDAISAGLSDAWDYRWQYTCWKHGLQSVAPYKNLALNIGFDAFATHTHQAPPWIPQNQFELPDINPFSFENLNEDSAAEKWYMDNVLGAGTIHRIKRRISRALP
jgi:hypothetical protein